MKVVYVFFLFFLFPSLYSFTVVIDPGHGGKDPGAIRNGIKEKDINLKVAFFLRRIIKKRLKKIRVVLTRDKDVFLSLQKRVEIANRYGNEEAVFISVHTNSHEEKSTVKGIEIYYFDNSSSRKRIKKRITLIEERLNYCYKETIRNVLNKLVHFKLVLDSKRLARNIAYALKKLNLRIRFIKPANFFVCSYVLNPSILIEIGYISEYSIRKNSYLYKVSAGVVNGILSFYKESKFF